MHIEGRTQVFCFLSEPLGVGDGDENHKFVTTDAADDIVSAERALQVLGKLLETEIAKTVATLVIDGLEIVDVHDEESIALSRLTLELVNDIAFQSRTGETASQGVKACLNFVGDFGIDILGIEIHVDIATQGNFKQMLVKAYPLKRIIFIGMEETVETAVDLAPVKSLNDVFLGKEVKERLLKFAFNTALGEKLNTFGIRSRLAVQGGEMLMQAL